MAVATVFSSSLKAILLSLTSNERRPSNKYSSKEVSEILTAPKTFPATELR